MGPSYRTGEACWIAQKKKVCQNSLSFIEFAMFCKTTYANSCCDPGYNIRNIIPLIQCYLCSPYLHFQFLNMPHQLFFQWFILKDQYAPSVDLFSSTPDAGAKSQQHYTVKSCRNRVMKCIFNSRTEISMTIANLIVTDKGAWQQAPHL